MARTNVTLEPGGTIALFLTKLVDLEPLGAGTVKLVTGGVTLSHVSHKRADFMRPLVEGEQEYT